MPTTTDLKRDLKRVQISTRRILCVLWLLASCLPLAFGLSLPAHGSPLERKQDSQQGRSPSEAKDPAGEKMRPSNVFVQEIDSNELVASEVEGISSPQPTKDGWDESEDLTYLKRNAEQRVREARMESKSPARSENEEDGEQAGSLMGTQQCQAESEDIAETQDEDDEDDEDEDEDEDDEEEEVTPTGTTEDGREADYTRG
eukprot:1232703-Rhodomonas_salina.1